MPDPETPAAAAAVKPFAAWLQEHRSGGLHQELSEALAPELPLRQVPPMDNAEEAAAS